MKQCVDQLLEAVPELRPAYEKHVSDYDELLAHVFFGDVTRYVAQKARLDKMGKDTPLERTLRVMERCLTSGREEVQELVAVSFVENLMEHSELLAALKPLMGPSLIRQFEDLGWRW